jgi:hypothetical protein
MCQITQKEARNPLIERNEKVSWRNQKKRTFFLRVEEKYLKMVKILHKSGELNSILAVWLVFFGAFFD